MGLILSFVAVVLMWMATTVLAAALLAFSIVYYGWFYTMVLKRRTAQNIVIGGAAGAFPPVIGWAAVTGTAPLDAWLMFAIIFFWTPPHFWALSLVAHKEYEKAGVPMLPTRRVDGREKRDYAGELIIAPPGAAGSRWMRRFRDSLTGFCSGWMQVRGNRRRRGYDRGFVLSDHADWPGPLRTIDEASAQRNLLMHGHADTLVRLLRERGVNAGVLSELRDA